MYCVILNSENVNEKREDSATALYKASQEGHADVCTVLLELNANVNEKSVDGSIVTCVT